MIGKDDKRIMNATKYVLYIFTAIIIVYMGFVISPEMYGDGREYMLMTESFQNHLSPELTRHDIETATENYKFKFELNRTDGKYPFGFFTNGMGKTYSYHFWLYSLLVLPIKVFLKFFNGNQLRCFQIFNSIIYILSLWYIYIYYNGTRKNKFFLVMLLMFNPALYYVIWTHTEVFTFSLVCISLIMYSNKEYEKAILIVSIAAMQNQPIIFLGGMYFLDYFICKYLIERKINLKEYFFQAIKKGIFFIPFFIPLIFYYVNYGTISLITSSGYVKMSGNIKKISSLFFDLNQGILAFMPILIITFFMILFVGLWRKSIQTLLNIVIIILIMFFCSLQVNWNPGEAGIMRYNVWITPILIYFVVTYKDKLLTNRFNKFIEVLIILSVFSTGIIIVSTGLFKYKYSNVEFNSVSKLILDTAPVLYNPQEEIFAERALNHEGYSEDDFPIIYSDKFGNVKKVLMNNNSINKLAQRLECNNDTVMKKVSKYTNYNETYYLNFTTEKIKVKQDIQVAKENQKFKISLINSLPYMEYNKEYIVQANVSNLGNQVWGARKETGKNPIGVSYHWIDEKNNVIVFDGNRTYFESPIYPNEQKLIKMSILTPNKKGNYKLMLDIVQEQVAWFSNSINNKYIVDVKVN